MEQAGKKMRRDGTRVKDANPIYTVMPYILKYRYDAMNMIEVDIPISPMQSYLNERRKQGYRFSHLGLVLAAYVRTAAEYPLLKPLHRQQTHLSAQRIFRRHGRFKTRRDGRHDE